MKRIQSIEKDGHLIELMGTRGRESKVDLVLVHGMAEHLARYAEFASAMAREGIDVTLYDQRGHGAQALQADTLGAGVPFDTLVADALAVVDAVTLEKGRKPYLMGHSMGSFVTLGAALQASDRIEGFILSGTGYYRKGELLGGRLFAKLACLLGREDQKAVKLHRLTFGKFAEAFPEAETSFDWLSSDREVVRAYINDPLCGFVPTYGFYRHFFDGLQSLFHKRLPQGFSSPIEGYMFSGNLDPVGNFSKGFFETYHHLRDAGAHLQYKLYEHARHEVLNETNRYEVYGDLVRWLHEQE